MKWAGKSNVISPDVTWADTTNVTIPDMTGSGNGDVKALDMKWNSKTDVADKEMKWIAKSEFTAPDMSWLGNGDVKSKDINSTGKRNSKGIKWVQKRDVTTPNMKWDSTDDVIPNSMGCVGKADAAERDIKWDSNSDVRSPDMSWSGKCDVEISITLAGEETVESIPECLQSAFLSSPGERLPEPRDHVVLPVRYTQDGNCTDCEKARMGDGLADRERDMHTALRWIKQEMILMKEQDKALMKQFINVRSGILQLRCLYDNDGSASDLSHDGSSLSLDETSASPCTLTSGYLASPDLEMTEFRARTTSLSVSPKGQSAKPVTRIKWKSHEYL